MYIEEKNPTKIFLQVDNPDENDVQIDLLNIAGHMAKRKKLYMYIMSVAVCIGVLLGLVLIVIDYISANNSYAQAVISFQYEGIEDGLDPNGAAFDINKIKSPTVIEGALNTLGITKYDTEDIRQNIAIEGVVPEDAVERITVIKEMALEDASNYEKILDVAYFPSQYIVYLYKCKGMSASDTTEILNAILESYRTYFLDTYANTEVLTITGNLINYENYDYLEAIDTIESQIEIMKDYVSERKKQAPDFRSSVTGLSFSDIESSLNTIENIDLVILSSYVESHVLTKDRERLKENYEYKIKKYNMDISELQVQLSNLQTTIDKYQKDPLVIVSSQETTQEIQQSNEYYDKLLAQKLSISDKLARMNKELNEAYTMLNVLNSSNTIKTQKEYDYADEKLSVLTGTVTDWAKLTEKTTEEYYTTTLFSNAYKIGVPAQYKAVGGITAMAKKILICVAVLVFITITVWCIDGFGREIKQMKKNRTEK